MSYQEKNITVYISTTLLVFSIYGVMLFGMYQEGRFTEPDATHFLGKSILILIAASIAVNIVVMILFSIINAIVTKECDHPMSDERDKVIELKGMKCSYIVFSIGFVTAMGLLALGSLPIFVIILIVYCMAIGDIAGNLTRLFYYRRGF